MEFLRTFILLLAFTVTYYFNSYESSRVLTLQYPVTAMPAIPSCICHPDNGGCHTHHWVFQFLHFCCLRPSLFTESYKYWSEGTRGQVVQPPPWSRTIANMTWSHLWLFLAESWKSPYTDLHYLWATYWCMEIIFSFLIVHLPFLKHIPVTKPTTCYSFLLTLQPSPDWCSFIYFNTSISLIFFYLC